MNFNKFFEDFKRKLKGIRPFLRTKTGSRLALIFIALFIVLFFAPLFHGFVGAAIFGCVGAVYLILIWRKYDKEHVIVPAVFITAPMLLDMAIYHNLAVVSCFIIAIIAVFIAARSRMVDFFDSITDMLYIYLAALGICVAVVVAAVLFMVIVSVSWWILCIVAFLALLGIFMGVIFSTAAYTATDGRRQAYRKHKAERESFETDEDETNERNSSRERRYENYRAPKRDNTIYNLDESDFRDID